MIDYLKNGWSYVHLFGSSVLAIGLYTKLIHSELAFIIAFALGLLWEFLDWCNKRFEWGLWFFDPQGFDWRDWLMDLTGIILAMWLIGGF